MWLSVLPLALGVLSAAVPVSTLGTGAALAVCFSPEEDCTAFAVDAIDRAETQILVNAYGLTTKSSTVEALIRAKQRGVDVRLIADRTTPCERNSGVAPLSRAGIPTWIDYSARIAHSKSMVIDRKVTLTGSMNWTGGAALNSENLNLVASRTIAAAMPGIGISDSHCRRLTRSEKIGAAGPRWPTSNRKRHRDEIGTGRADRRARLSRPAARMLVGEVTTARDRRANENSVLEAMRRLWWRVL